MVVSLKRILAIDVGVGTEDVLLYDSAKLPENNIKMVFPSMTRVLAKRVFDSKGDLFFYGETMGGGPLTNAVMKHIKKKYRVTMAPTSAMTIRDNPEIVKKIGIKIAGVCAANFKGEKIETMDVDFNLLKKILGNKGEKFQFNCVGIAVQDHGHVLGKSDREVRFEKIREALKKSARMQELGHVNPPKYYTRMNAVIRTARKFFSGKIFVVDTKIAATVGALHGVKERPAISVDVGNGHTLVSIVGRGDRMLGILEHHTGMLTRKKLERLIVRFAGGEVTNEEIFNDGGHGCYIKKKVGIKKVKRIMVTGPKRELLKGSKIKAEFANPLGDVMMTGTIGIVDMIKATL